MRKLFCAMMSFMMLTCVPPTICEAGRHGKHKYAFTEQQRSRQHLTSKQQKLETKRQRMERKREALNYQKHAKDCNGDFKKLNYYY